MPQGLVTAQLVLEEPRSHLSVQRDLSFPRYRGVRRRRPGQSASQLPICFLTFDPSLPTAGGEHLPFIRVDAMWGLPSLALVITLIQYVQAIPCHQGTARQTWHTMTDHIFHAMFPSHQDHVPRPLTSPCRALFSIPSHSVSAPSLTTHQPFNASLSADNADAHCHTVLERNRAKIVVYVCGTALHCASSTQSALFVRAHPSSVYVRHPRA